jgi:hypothetical protein
MRLPCPKERQICKSEIKPGYLYVESDRKAVAVFREHC